MSEENLKKESTLSTASDERISKADVVDAGLEQQLEFNGKKKPRSYTITTREGQQIKVKSVRSKYKLTPGTAVFFILDYLFFIVFTLSCLFPFYYLFINTISDGEEVASGAVKLIPKGITLDNYRSLQSVGDLGNSVIVSVVRTIIGTALMVAASAFVGYLVTKNEMWHKKFFYRFLVITMYFNAGLIPWYMNMQMLGLTDKFAAYLIPGIVAPYNIILVKTYIESIPGELEESAFIDGASHMKVFTSIVWPLSKPILATIAIFGAVGNWNSFQDSLILMQNSPKYYTLQHRLYIYLQGVSNLSSLTNSVFDDSSKIDFTQNSEVVKYTISMVSMIPILMVYPFMQRYFEEGIMLGAVKG